MNCNELLINALPRSKRKESMLLYYRCGLGFFMLIVHIGTNLYLPLADTMQMYIKQTHWITLMQICTNEKNWY